MLLLSFKILKVKVIFNVFFYFIILYLFLMANAIHIKL